MSCESQNISWILSFFSVLKCSLFFPRSITFFKEQNLPHCIFLLSILIAFEALLGSCLWKPKKKSVNVIHHDFIHSSDQARKENSRNSPLRHLLYLHKMFSFFHFERHNSSLFHALSFSLSFSFWDCYSGILVLLLLSSNYNNLFSFKIFSDFHRDRWPCFHLLIVPACHVLETLTWPLFFLH